MPTGFVEFATASILDARAARARAPTIVAGGDRAEPVTDRHRILVGPAVSCRSDATGAARPAHGRVRRLSRAPSPRTQASVVDGDDSIGIIVNLGERGTVTQRGREVALGAGDAVAVLHQEPATVAFAQGTYLGISVPRAALASRVKDIDDATMRLIPHGTEPLRLLLSYLRLVAEELVLATPKLRRMVVSHVHDLMALALRPHHAVGESDSSAVRAARLKAALDQIAACFQDPELSVAVVAESQGISPRYLQRLLEGSGTSFTARVNELRLQRAFALLCGPGTRRIADIALHAGFSDISHFNRLFRARFGDTPSAVRAQRFARGQLEVLNLLPPEPGVRAGAI